MDAQTAQSPNSRIAALVPESCVSTPNERRNQEPRYSMLPLLSLLIAACVMLLSIPAHAQSNRPFDDTMTITTPEAAPEFVRNGTFFGHWPDGYKGNFEKRTEGVTPFNVVAVVVGDWAFVQQRPGIWTSKDATFKEAGRDHTGVYLESVEDNLWVIFDFDRQLVFRGPRNSNLFVLGNIGWAYRASWAFRIINYDDKYAARPLPTQKHPEQSTGEFRQFVQAAREDYRAADKEFGITDGPTPGSTANQAQPPRDPAVKFLRNGPSRGHWPDGYDISKARTDRAVTGFNITYVVQYAPSPSFSIAQYELGEWRSTIDGVPYVFEEVGRDRNAVYLEDNDQDRWIKIDVVNRKVLIGPVGGPLSVIAGMSYAGRPDWSYPSYDPSHPNARNVERLVPYIVHPSASEQEIVRFRAAVAEDYRIGAEHRRAEDEYMRQNGF